MKIYAFASRFARGGAYLVAGTNIRDAALKIERSLGRRPTMGNTATASDLANCDQSQLTEDECVILGERLREAEADAARVLAQIGQTK
ncbi:hypothetical protein G7068_13660 [Leucobacter viscericola]|uniref:Uncharacterized protein n=1 Tax=Leucobacter viscericola TaxID=2714935 RepID=A0A6G7XHT6_9MICO|nr:hypothetical protein [Leucobacter viscericola]QIK64125.1 hypothetical protein G7068_13660 [Leucobacter viscericola]